MIFRNSKNSSQKCMEFYHEMYGILSQNFQNVWNSITGHLFYFLLRKKII